MKLNIYKPIFWIITIVILVLSMSCEKFVEVEIPNHKIGSEVVFSNDKTAISAMTGVYNQLFNTSFSGGGSRSVTFLGGLSADELQGTTGINEIIEYEENEITVANTFNLDLWSGAYNVIYMVNAIIEGVENSKSLSDTVRNRLIGEAKFVRAFTFFQLVNLYGDVPLLLTTDYRINAIASRNTSEEVYQQIVKDLENAELLLDGPTDTEERTRPNRLTVLALLARVHLYLQHWALAEAYASSIIVETNTYELLEDLDKVFLANSREAIWQISPIGRGSSLTHTNEGNIFIKTPAASTPVALTEQLLGAFDLGDARLTHWVSSLALPEGTYHFPYKYKVQYNNSGGEITEYSMVLRLAEQYLIRAEAYARQGRLVDAINDIDIIRGRANLPLIVDTHPMIDRKAILQIILEERRLELFAEWGHRWLDLKRFGNIDNVLTPIKPLWSHTDVFYPIPEDERMKNPNMGQNTGY